MDLGFFGVDSQNTCDEKWVDRIASDVVNKDAKPRNVGL